LSDDLMICTADMDAAPLRPVERRTLPEEVLDRLLDLIAAGNSPTQRLLPEHVLCERLDVSRGVLREALSALGQLGSTIAAQTHILRRAAAAESLPERIEHALEVRQLLEPPMARLAAQRATPQALEAIQRFLQLMERTRDGLDSVVACDSGFHVSIARATGNAMLVHLISAVADALTSTRRLSLEAAGGIETSLAGHRVIVDALLDRDPDGAQTAMQRHLDDVAKLIQRGPSG